MKTIKTYRVRHVLVAMVIIMAAVVSSCSTGIESTKTIKMNKDDLRQMNKTDEQVFASQIEGQMLKDWKIGKRFLAADDRTRYIFEPSAETVSDNESFEGKSLQFSGIVTKLTPDLKEECVIVFSDGSQDYVFATGKSQSDAMSEIDSSKLPLLVDVDIIDEWKNKLTGKTLWTRSNLWYDGAGHRKDGLKFAEVDVIDVVPATGDFPMNVEIRHGGETAYIRMNYTSEKGDSRNFAAIFFLSDPRIKYPGISDENWSLIQKGKVREGMTKEECRLSIGYPDELQSGHSTSQTMDIWQYSNGTYLFFSDGLLTRFRQ